VCFLFLPPFKNEQIIYYSLKTAGPASGPAEKTNCAALVGAIKKQLANE
jgi:hypothetical protein